MLKDKSNHNGEKNLWRGRLSRELKPETAQFISSLKEDARIVEIDIDVVEAHNLMLYKQGIITRDELAKILAGLEQTRADWRTGKLKLDPQQIDIHPIVEKYVIDLYGLEIGGKTHCGKSRNDQVITDVLIYLRDQNLEICGLLVELVRVFLNIAGAHTETVMPGYTHTQHAQSTTLAHYLLAYTDAFLRDIERLGQVYARWNKNPLGACAFGGTTFEIDRKYTARLLGFDGILENTIDVVSNRDFALEYASALAIIASSLSKMAEDLVIWSTYEFNMVELADDLTDTSSAMPQKKNPCPIEMVRGKAASVFSSLMNLLIMLKGIPTGYNKDLQETKPPLWQAIDTVKPSINIIKMAIETLKINQQRMLELTQKNHITAIDLAEFLVQQTSLSFREAHFVVGNLVQEAIEAGIQLCQLPVERIKTICLDTLNRELEIDEHKFREVTDPQLSILRRRAIGGPAPVETQRMITNREQRLAEIEAELKQREAKLARAREHFQQKVSQLRLPKN
jgi:argininosuccinate lyase